MGRKVHPVGFRVGIIRDWQAKWYAEKHYVEFLREDLELRRAISSKYARAGISLVEIDRQGDKVLVTIHTARPGVVIGRGGQRVDEMKQYLEDLIGNKVQLNIQEIRQPEMDAYLVAVTVAEQIERRIAYRRAMKQAIFRTIEAGAKGIRINCAGRLAGAEIARREVLHQGQVPLHKLRADIDYGFTEACTTLGRIGVKVWIYKGDILPEAKVAEAEEMPAVLAAEEGMPMEPVVGIVEPVEELAGLVSGEVGEAVPAVELEGEPAEPVVELAEPIAEVPAPVEVEEKVVKPRGKKKAVAEAPAPVEAEEKVVKPRGKKKAVAEVPAPVEVEEKVVKPRGRKKAVAEVPAPVEAEGQDATT